jgi:hypothetical protein
MSEALNAPQEGALMQLGDRLNEAVARLEAQLERTEAARAQLEARLGIDLDEQTDDGLEELWELDLNAPLDAYLDRA